MLIELHIENFAIIENLDLNLSPGLIAFTGETGAGKSIIIDAIETLIGGRAESIQVRSGEERANIEGIFKLSGTAQPAIRSILQREDLLDDEHTITLAREIRINGRNVARVNGRSVSIGLLREISESLIDIHGQSEHLSLFRINQHLALLDRFAVLQPNNRTQSSLEKYRNTYHKIQQVMRELNDIRQIEQESARKEDMLKYQINEIESAKLRPGEEEELVVERNRLANAESLAKYAQEALQILDEGNFESPAATDLIGRASEMLSALSKLDPLKSNLSESAQSIFESITDLTRNLRNYSESIEFNPKRLDQVEERLALLQLLKRKYGDSISIMLKFLEQAKLQLDQLYHAEERIQELELQLETLLKNLGSEGVELSEQRRLAAKLLEIDIEHELNDLQMEGARFCVDFHQQGDPLGAWLPDNSRCEYYPHGLDKVEFLIAPNPGEGFKPLVKIASGGETSRLMLALKNVLANADEIPTLIFDEIDQGVGGRVGSIVGHKLWQLANRHQVFCITHLPQLAAYGDQHYHIEKVILEGRTITLVNSLKGEERVMELAQMLGGKSEGTLHSARELLQNAHKPPVG